MLLSLKINNCFAFNSEVEFSMRANMHYKRFASAVATIKKINVLKTAVLFGPNNSGKTSFVNAVRLVKSIMLNHKPNFSCNIFTESYVIEVSASFVENDKEYIFEVKYDTDKEEYIYERFAEVVRDSGQYAKENDVIVRDFASSRFYCLDDSLQSMMSVASKNNILIYLMDADSFPVLKNAKETIVSFASKIDIVNMNNIPLKKTIEMLKNSNTKNDRIVNFIKNADLSLDDFRYWPDDKIKMEITKIKNVTDGKPEEKVLEISESVIDMLHLVSVYKGVPVPSVIFDSTGTKKIAALASYVIEALENGKILVIDELDNSLHFQLTRAIIALFNNELNEKAQLIVTAHDVSLLDCKTLFRKEQIWFTYKDTDNTYLYSLAEFTAEKDGVRDTSDLIEKYKSGIFGALPDPDLFNSLLEVRKNG